MNGAKLHVDSNLLRLEQNVDRQKRGADDAFGQEKSSDPHLQQAFDVVDSTVVTESTRHTEGIQDINTRIMANMLGLGIPGIQPSTSFFPAYEWWPRTATTLSHSPLQSQIAGVTNQPTLIDFGYRTIQPDQEWDVQGTLPYSYQYNYQNLFNGYY